MSTNQPDNKNIEQLYGSIHEVNAQVLQINSILDSILNGTADSVSPSTGCLVLKGGLGVGKSVNIGQDLHVLNNLTVDGNIYGTISGYNEIHVTSTTDATDIYTGAITCSGGMSCVKNFHCGDQISGHAGLSITGSSLFSGSATIGSGIFVTGNSTVTGQLTVSNKLIVSSGGLDITGPITMTSPLACQELTVTPSTPTAISTFGSAIDVTGKITCSDTLNVTGGGISIVGDSQIDGATLITGILTGSSGISVLSGGIEILGGGLTVVGGTTTFGTALLTCDVNIVGEVKSQGNFNIIGDLTVTGVDEGVVLANSSGKLSGGQIIDANIADTAGISWLKMGLTTLAGDIIIGDATRVPTSTTMTGDMTISSSGVATISNGVVTNAKLAGSIEDSKLNTISTSGKVANTATTGTATATGNTLALRDISGDSAFHKLTTVDMDATGDINLSAVTSSLTIGECDGIYITEGINGISGITRLVGGTVTVSGLFKLQNTSRIMYYPYLTTSDTFVGTNYGHLVVTNLGSGSFRIDSSNTLDNRRIHYVITNPL